MDTLTIILIMVAMAVALLAAAALADRRLQARRDKRRLYVENPELAPNKRDAADAVIDMLNRSGEIARQALKTSREDTKE